MLWYYPTVDRFRFNVVNGSVLGYVDANSLGSPQTGQWYFILAWHNAANDTGNIQVDNGPLDTANWSGGTLDGSASFVIGSHNDLTSYAHNGRIDEVGLWKRVLTSQERAQLYNSEQGLAYPFNQPPPTPPPTEPGWLRQTGYASHTATTPNIRTP